MPIVNVQIGNRGYTLSCGEGEEGRLHELAQDITARIQQITDAIGEGTSDSVLLAMAALMMQDEIHDLNEQLANAPITGSSDKPIAANSDNDKEMADAIAAISDYVETIAQRIESKQS